MIAAAALASLALAAPAPGPASSARVGDAVARVHGNQVLLADSKLTQEWTIGPLGQVNATAVIDRGTGRDWAAGSAPDFQLDLGSVSTTSAVGWRLQSLRAERTSDGGGVQLAFRYGLAVRRSVVELERTWTLYPGAGVSGVSTTLVNDSPAALRVGDYALAQLTATAPAEAQVLAYHGGSDWRQDFRVSTTEPGTFDDEGEVARFDDGTGQGWFLVGQRRSGVMSRVARDTSGRTWVGEEPARDLFDWGPLMSSPPDYNRLANPAYPAPIRQRTALPLSRLDLGTGYLGVYHGGAQQAGAAFAANFSAHVTPPGIDTVDLNSFHPWQHGPGLRDANLRPQAALFKQLGGEVFMLDDTWQVPSTNGDWQWDSSRFPPDSAGVPRFVDYVHSLGLKLGLWLSPAEFSSGSATYQQHPQWACAPVGDATAQDPQQTGLGVWDYTNQGLQDYMTGVIDRLIAQDGVREFKFDFVTWLDCPPHDYRDYEDAYAHWVHIQQERHPGVTFELDETNDQRLWPFRSAALGPSWFDNGHLQGTSYPSRLLHDVFSAAPWIPPATLGFGTYDGDLTAPYTAGYLMPMALLGHFTFWTDLTRLSAADQAETAWWLAWYEAHRSELTGAVYEDLSTDPVDGSSWAAFQPWSRGHGYLFAFSQSTGGTQTIALHGLHPVTQYTVSDVRTGAVVGTFTGAQLQAGLPISLAPYSAQVLAITPA